MLTDRRVLEDVLRRQHVSSENDCRGSEQSSTVHTQTRSKQSVQLRPVNLHIPLRLLKSKARHSLSLKPSAKATHDRLLNARGTGRAETARLREGAQLCRQMFVAMTPSSLRPLPGPLLGCRGAQLLHEVSTKCAPQQRHIIMQEFNCARHAVQCPRKPS